MMAGVVTRGLSVLETLVGRVDGVSLAEVAELTGIPKSAVHRTLAELSEAGYVRQDGPLGEYTLTLRFVSFGLRHLSNIGVVNLAKPLLAGLATEARALVRLSLVDNDSLVFVGRFQGATSGLRYDPEHGDVVHLVSSASGHAWLAQLPEERALSIVYSQGFGDAAAHGPNCPQTLDELRACFAEVSERGFAEVEDSFEPGTSALAAPVRNSDDETIGVVSIAGPTALLDSGRRTELAPVLLQATTKLSDLNLPIGSSLV
jgi:DNA-binding IclR family transcriptional regulator